MSRVDVMMNNGRIKKVSLAHARILKRLGKAIFYNEGENPVETFEKTDMYDNMGLEELRVIAKERGLDIHHRAGLQKVKEALRCNDV